MNAITSAAGLRDHFDRTVLPLWRGPGFDAALRLPYEALDANGQQPLPVTRYRAMACARQLYVFSQAGDAAHAHTLFDALMRFGDRERGGWFYSVDPQGAPLDTTKDLYTHAFVVFACAAYGRRFGVGDAFDVVHRTSALIVDRFAASDGLLNAALDAGFANVSAAPLQNPLMHLTEAWLLARDATGDAAFDTAITRVIEAVTRTFLHTPTGCIAELPVGDADNRLEPGHQFEWFWLAAQAGGRLGASGLDAHLTRAFAFAVQQGVDPASGAVCAALDEQGNVIDATQRIWAQTEYLRAIATHRDAAVQATLPAQIGCFAARFLTPRGWVECRNAAGEVARADMPSTTPYHLLTAYQALPA
ncbi:AGE family epimerase/isomerase [Paraburkholderia caballeronis]|uniref:Mannose-6-phosphate isomerase n=1 Tax=Paraburkholderia caballeronis TaxID=416943 RepID=A0A1H7VJ99_9BURK|nr:AGE family epimerase/isomerase [Paraburkholderia caballeronis]PXW16033.1 mannose-6-phosphate isomerase [Paraburkholderia caballeronis]PXW93935.1 mannose-6-phosphate isomerase [Paraburkholderia caballeronis]RAJ89064.1 mannose-6-phosphate isomerase [Paraburkholderia caballeronis]SED90086.1 mannose-6-phosphate isomerase [Paraburkholderia caballeronis]SEM08897.1 mannose-6-phosphate isomerase [Paraburkholderia caballeronis]